MSTTSSTTSALPPPSTNTTVVVAATSSSSNPSSSSTSIGSVGGGSTCGGGVGATTTLNVSTVPLTQNLLTAIQLKQIGEGLSTSGNATDVKKISSITTATPIVTSASSIQPIANLINTQHASLVKSKIMGSSSGNIQICLAQPSIVGASQVKTQTNTNSVTVTNAKPPSFTTISNMKNTTSISGESNATIQTLTPPTTLTLNPAPNTNATTIRKLNATTSGSPISSPSSSNPQTFSKIAFPLIHSSNIKNILANSQSGLGIVGSGNGNSLSSPSSSSSSTSSTNSSNNNNIFNIYLNSSPANAQNTNASPQAIAHLNQFTTATTTTPKANPNLGTNINISINSGSSSNTNPTSKIILTNEKQQSQTQSRFLTSGIVSNGSTLNTETTKNTIPINLKSSANGASLNLKSKSPISFISDNGQITTLNSSSSPSTVTLLSTAPVSNQASSKLTLTSVRGLANVNTTTTTTQLQANNSGAPLNLTSFIKPSSGSSPQVLLTNISGLNNNENMKTQLQQQNYVNNIVNLANSNLIATPSTFHTIAQLYSNNSNTNQFHVRQPNNNNNQQQNNANASITSGSVNTSPAPQFFQTFQPIRLISNSNVNLSSINNNSNQTTVTLTNTKLPSTLLTNNNSSNINSNNSSQSSNMQTVSSPSSSPAKPNIIRKARRDSPSHSTISSDHMNNNHYHAQQQQHIKDLKPPIFELTEFTSKNNSLSSIPIPLSLIPQPASTSSTSSIASSSSSIIELNNVNIYQNQFQQQATASSISSASSAQPTNYSNSQSKTILNLINESSGNFNNQETTKNFRKFTLANHHINNISSAQPSTSSLATTSSSTSSSTTTDLNCPSTSSQPTSSPAAANLDVTNQNESTSSTKRKSRKQEFKKHLDTPMVVFENTPNSTSTSLYSFNNNNESLPSNVQFRYVNDNPPTNVKIKQPNLSKKSSNNFKLKNFNLNVKNSEYFNDTNDFKLNNDDNKLRSLNEKDVKLEIDEKEGDDDSIRPPISKIPRISEKRKTNIKEAFASNSSLKQEKLESLDNESMVDDQQECNELNDDSENSNGYLDDDAVNLLSKEFSYISSTGLRWISKSKSAQIGIRKFQKPTWQPRNNHYVHYSDIPINSKDNVNLLKSFNTTNNNSNATITHKELIENLKEWKFHYILSQINNLIDYENESLKVINEVENLIQNTKFEGLSDITFKINESIKANTQRHHFINEQLDETQILIHKLFDHKEKFKNQMLIAATTSKPASNQLASSSTSLNQKNNSSISSRNISSKGGNLASVRKNLKKTSISTRSNLKNAPKNNRLDSKPAKS